MKPEPRPHRASDNGARALLCASPTPTGQVPCCGLPPPGPATEPGREAQATASVGVCAGRSSCPTDRTARSGSPEPRTGVAKDLKIPCCRLGHTLAWTQRAEPWAGDMAWLGCCQGGRGCGHEGQEFLPCLPGHVQNSDVHTEALRVVPGPSSGGAGPLAGREGSGAARMLGLPSVYRLSQAPAQTRPRSPDSGSGQGQASRTGCTGQPHGLWARTVPHLWRALLAQVTGGWAMPSAGEAGPAWRHGGGKAGCGTSQPGEGWGRGPQLRRGSESSTHFPEWASSCLSVLPWGRTVPPAKVPGP